MPLLTLRAAALFVALAAAAPLLAQGGPDDRGLVSNGRAPEPHAAATLAVVPSPAAGASATPPPLTPRVPVLTGDWTASDLSGDDAVTLHIDQQSNLSGEFDVARYHKATFTLSDPHTATTGRDWARTLTGFVNQHGEVHAMGDFRATWGNSRDLAARTMLFGVLKNGELKVNVHSQIADAQISAIVPGWPRFLALKKASGGAR